MKRSWTLWTLALSSVLMLSACGGGGGGGGGAGLAALGALPVAGAGTASTSVTLSGAATYDSIPNTTGPLQYSATSQKPVRGAALDVLGNAGNVIASTTTDGNGAYSVTVPANTIVTVRVKAQLAKSGAAPTWDVTVRDNTQSDAIYAMETEAFSTGSGVVRNVAAPSGWDGTRYSGRRVAGPFAILDAIYTAQNKVLSAAPSANFPLLRVFWSVNNVPASGSVTLGQIGSTFFRSSGSDRSIFVLGKEDVDTDEYDSSVVVHEWGHYYQSAFSRDDSPGGPHSLTDRLDRRVAFSEGWGDAWSGIALERSNYTDSLGAGQARGGNVDLSRGPTSVAPGWFSEASITSILWNLNRQVGFKPLHDTMTGPLKSGLPVISIHPFAAAFAAVAPGSVSVLTGLLTGQNISASTSDPFGQNETNNGGVTSSLPLYGAATVGAQTNACVTNQAGVENKIGSYSYFRFTAPSTRNYTITVAGPTNAVDPDFVVFGGRVVATADQVGQTETSSVSLTAGEYVLAVNDFNNNSVCLSVNIQ